MIRLLHDPESHEWPLRLVCQDCYDEYSPHIEPDEFDTINMHIEESAIPLREFFAKMRAGHYAHLQSKGEEGGDG